ncbi:MAG TPA: hypothetical protein VHZ03_51420 [Trebonia sp.]|jgi:hypothetical protein|nr:hypothetical protein [Trebonia sp.]
MGKPDQDFGAETARFQAFVQERDDEIPPAWRMGVPASRIGLLAGVVVAVAIVAALIALAIVG